MKNNVPALQRGCEILLKVSETPGISISELEEQLQIPIASLNRMLRCLKNNGFLNQDPKNKKLRIGDVLTHAVTSSHENALLTRTVRKMLTRLVKKWDVTFVVYEYQQPFDIIWRAKLEPENGIITRAPGLTTSNMNKSAQGQLFLSRLPDEIISVFFKHKLAQKGTEFTIMTEELMMARIAEIRSQGYAFQERENHPSMKQLAVPLNFRNIPGTFALGCFLPITFSEIENLKDDMLYESGLLTNQE